MANFASSGIISNAIDAGENVQVNTGLNLNFEFNVNPDLGSVIYTVESVAFIFADQSQAFGFDVKVIKNVNLNLKSRISSFTKDSLFPNSMSTEQFYVPVGKSHDYALIYADFTSNKCYQENASFESNCEPSSYDDPQWALNNPSRWGQQLEQNNNPNADGTINGLYAIFYAPLEIENGSGTYTLNIPVNEATCKIKF